MHVFKRMGKARYGRGVMSRRRKWKQWGKGKKAGRDKERNSMS